MGARLRNVVTRVASYMIIKRAARIASTGPPTANVIDGGKFCTPPTRGTTTEILSWLTISN